MRPVRVLGVDPGPTTGISVLRWAVSATKFVPTIVDAIQGNHQVAVPIYAHLLKIIGPDLVAIERFVVGRSSMKSGLDGEITRTMIGQLDEAARLAGIPVVMRSAAEVKPWATDDRLAHVGVLEPTKSMRHSRDAARHALYAAVKDLGLPDPLSKRS